MGTVKDWLIGMEEDAAYLPLDEWIDKHSISNRSVYDRVRHGKKSPPIECLLFPETKSRKVFIPFMHFLNEEKEDG
jgi:hypothetical protein